MTAHATATLDLARSYGITEEPKPTGIDVRLGDLGAEYREWDYLGGASDWQALPAHIDAPYPGDDLADIVLAIAEHIGASIDGGEITTDSDFATWQA